MESLIQLLMLGVLLSSLVGILFALVRVWFLFEEKNWGSIPENIWISHQIWFETLWILCGTLSIVLLFVFPVWVYTQQYNFSEANRQKMPIPVLLYVWPVLNWFFLYFSNKKIQAYQIEKGLEPWRPISQWNYSGRFLGLFLIPLLAICHLVIWFYPFYDLIQYLYQAYALIALGFGQILWLSWTKGWFDSQKVWNRI